MLQVVILAVTAFVGTNLDDIFMDTLLFSGEKTGSGRWAVAAGKYLGIGILILLSVLGAFGLQFLPEQYLGFLGLLPIALGIRELIGAFREEEEEENTRRSSGLVLNAALITLANGADNIGVYIPLFSGFAPWQIAVTVAVFGVMMALWCLLTSTLSRLPVLQRFIEKYKKLLVPTVYMALGAYILLTSFL